MTNETTWETSQPQTRDHKHPAWETMKRTGRQMKRSGKGSGRQAGTRPQAPSLGDKEMKGKETNEKK